MYDALSRKVSYDFEAGEQLESKSLRMVFSRKHRTDDIEQKKVNRFSFTGHATNTTSSAWSEPSYFQSLWMRSLRTTSCVPYIDPWTHPQGLYVVRNFIVLPSMYLSQEHIDRCLSGIFSASWFCRDCGKEFCLACFDGPVQVRTTFACDFLHSYTPRISEEALSQEVWIHPPDKISLVRADVPSGEDRQYS